MTVTYNTVKEVYGRNYGSERLYKRSFCNSLLYTEGVMDFQKTLNSYWVVDNVVSYMPKVLQAYKENEFTILCVRNRIKPRATRIYGSLYGRLP